MDRRLGEPLPHQLSNPTRAHPCAINLWQQKHAIPLHYAVLSSVSRCYPPHKGRLLTRYSPVRHWSDPKVVTVRLECVMHAASVHPEPGSNSQTNCISSALAVRFLSELFILAFFTFLELCSLWFWQIFVFALAFLLCTSIFCCSIVKFQSRPFCERLSIISLSFSLVNTFFKISLKNFLTGFVIWWANRDSNPGPTGYEPVALTNWAIGPS